MEKYLVVVVSMCVNIPVIVKNVGKLAELVMTVTCGLFEAYRIYNRNYQ